MKLLIGQDLGKALCMAIGIDPGKTTDIQINLKGDHIVTVSATIVINEDTLAEAVRLVKLNREQK